MSLTAGASFAISLGNGSIDVALAMSPEDRSNAGSFAAGLSTIFAAWLESDFFGGVTSVDGLVVSVKLVDLVFSVSLVVSMSLVVSVDLTASIGLF